MTATTPRPARITELHSRAHQPNGLLFGYEARELFAYVDGLEALVIAATKAVHAWADSYDCSADPGHQVMSSAIDELAAALLTALVVNGLNDDEGAAIDRAAEAFATAITDDC